MANVCYFQCIIFIIGAVAGKLTREPEDTEAAVGSTATLRCQTDVRGAEQKVEWRFNAANQKEFALTIIYKRGRVLNGYQDNIEVSEDPSTGTYDLKILNVSLSNAGSYTCDDDHTSKAAELIVIERYPADQFCSLTTPTDCVLGKNKCSIDSDAVRMSCQLRYKASTELYLEWRNGQRPINSSTETDVNGVTTSTIQVKAEEIQSENFSCHLMYRNQKISKFAWTTTVSVTTIVDSEVVTEGDCDLHETNCSSLDSSIYDRCEYVWTDENRSVVARGAHLDLTHLPSKNYTCLATCSIRQTSCSLVAEKFAYKCNKTSTYERPSKSREPTNLLLIISIVAVPVLLFVGIAIFLMKRRLSGQMKLEKVLNEKEKEKMMQNVVQSV